MTQNFRTFYQHQGSAEIVRKSRNVQRGIRKPKKKNSESRRDIPPIQTNASSPKNLSRKKEKPSEKKVQMGFEPGRSY